MAVGVGAFVAVFELAAVFELVFAGGVGGGNRNCQPNKMAIDKTAAIKKRDWLLLLP